jgi:hypothetical protein
MVTVPSLLSAPEWSDKGMQMQMQSYGSDYTIEWRWL